MTEAKEAEKVAQQAVDDINEGAQKAEDKLKKGEKAAVCATAALFAVMTGVRAGNLAAMEAAQRDACQKVEDLMSAAIAAGTSSAATNPMAAILKGDGGGALSTQIAGMSPAQKGAYATCIREFANAPTCITQTLGTGTTATDSGLLSRVPPNALPEMPSLDGMSALARQVAQEGVGATMGSMMGNNASGAADLIGLAQSAAESGGALRSIMGMESSTQSTYQGGGGGSGGGSSKNSDFNKLIGLNHLGGLGDKPAGGSKGIELSFRDLKNIDIWHTHTSLSLFEIVSQKIGQVSRQF